jgi:hypothetical protein
MYGRPPLGVARACLGSPAHRPVGPPRALYNRRCASGRNTPAMTRYPDAYGAWPRHDDSAPPGTARIRRLLGWTAQRHLVPKLSCHTPTKDRPDEVQAPRDRHVQARGTSKPVFTVHCADEQERPVLGANAGAPRWKASLPARMQPRWSWRPVVAPTIAAGCCTNRGIGFAWAR